MACRVYLGLFAAPILMAFIGAPVVQTVSDNLVGMAIAGLLVGIGTSIDRPLIAGAAISGIGWGIGGYCPGPALTALPLLAPGTLIFVPAMVLGLWLGVHANNLSILSPKGATS